MPRSAADLSRCDLTRGTRGKYVAKARRSFETVTVDKKVLEALGGADAARDLLTALANSITVAQKRRRRAA